MQETSTQLKPIALHASGDQLEQIRRGLSPTNSAGRSASNGVIDRLKLGSSKFWSRQISVVTGQKACRDHYANERTFLGYLRTSSAFATLGILACQLFLLESENVTKSCRSQYGKGIAYACEGSAIIIALSGVWRFWRNQNAILRNKIHAGGWEIYTTGVCGLIVVVTTFVIVILSDCE